MGCCAKRKERKREPPVTPQCGRAVGRGSKEARHQNLRNRHFFEGYFRMGSIVL
jgi:hypothetical protein